MNRIIPKLPILMLGLVSGLTGCQELTPAAATTPAAPPPLNVPTVVLEPTTIPLFFDFVGHIQSMQAVDIRAQVTGIVATRNFEEGRTVDRDTPLYTLEALAFQANLDQARALLRAEEAKLQERQQELERFQQLVNRGGVTRSQVDGVAAQVAVSRAQIDALKAQVARAQVDVDFARIQAPFRGYIEQTQVHPGELVTAQQTVLTRLVQLDPIHVMFTVSRNQSFEIEQLARTKNTAQRREDVTVEVLQPDGTPYPHAGFVDFISGEIDPRTDAVQVRGQLPNPNGVLRPGQFTRVRVTLGENPDQLLVSETAITQDQDGHYVFIVNAERRAELRKVILGQRIADKRLILNGLQPHDRVITEGLIRVRPGVEIVISDGE